MTETLIWPVEATGSQPPLVSWYQIQSNYVLDFHGDCARAKLCLLSEGNHFMALTELVHYFEQQYDIPVFFVTLPPGLLLSLMRQGGVEIGNLQLHFQTHAFIAPFDFLDNLYRQGEVLKPTVFVQNRGNVMLVQRGNPKAIQSVDDLLANGVRLFLSHPRSEKASHENYVNTLLNLLAADNKPVMQGMLNAAITRELGDQQCHGSIGAENIVFGEKVHHREAPLSLLQGRADVCLLYYHLARYLVAQFPDAFELMPLVGATVGPEPIAGNVQTRSAISLLQPDYAPALQFREFLLSKRGRQIYRSHGLLPQREMTEQAAM